MRRAILTMLMAVASGSVAAQLVTPAVAPSYWMPWNEVQMYAPDLVWKNNEIPKTASTALPKWMTKKDAEEPSWANPIAFASIDLDGDGSEELIVQSGEWFSGGPEFAILQKRGNRWRTIGEIQGGFTIAKRPKNGYADIETWSRHPETYHQLWKFSGGRYRSVRREIGPWENRGFALPYVPGARR